MTSHVTYVMVQTSCPTSVYCHSTDHYLTQEWPLNSLNCSPDLEYNDNVTCVLGMSVQPGRPAAKYGCKAQTSFLTQKHIIVKTIGLSLMTWSREFLPMPQIYDLCLYDPSRLHWLSNGMIEQNDVQEN